MPELKDYQSFASKLIGKPFKDAELLLTAFTHCSYLNEHRRSAKEHNERLEFLGDAVLEIIVTEYLYLNYQQPEGILTNWRAALVRTESLSSAATRLGFRKYLRLSKGEKRSSSRAQEQILANTFEAVLGAIYLDQGYRTASDFVKRHVIVTLKEILRLGSWLDPKTRLQEHVQNSCGQTPVYRLLSEEGPDHDKTFFMGVYVQEAMVGKGRGYSKQAAQQSAAQAALKDQKIDPPSL